VGRKHPLSKELSTHLHTIGTPLIEVFRGLR